MYFYRQTFTFYEGGYGSALAWAMFIVIMTLTGDRVLVGPLLGPLPVREEALMAADRARPVDRDPATGAGRDDSAAAGFGDLDRPTRRYLVKATVTLFAVDPRRRRTCSRSPTGSSPG